MILGTGIGIGFAGSGGGGAAPATPQTIVVDTFRSSGTWNSPASAGSAIVQCWGGGGGGTTDTGAGGGGAFAQDTFSYAASTGYPVVIGAAAAANTDGADTTFNTSTVVAKGGLSGGNGGNGGTAAASTGSVKFDGGNGGQGTGVRVGGGGAGDKSAAALNVPGEPTGGLGSSSFGRVLGAGGGSSGTGQTGGIRGECRVFYTIDATAGFPRVTGHSCGRSTADSTSVAASLPTSTAGRLLLLLVASDGVPTITVDGWTKVGQVSEGTSQVSLALFTKIAEGGDTATIELTASEIVTYKAWEIADAGAVEWTTASGSSTNPNPPEHTPSGGSAKYLWIAAAAWDNSGNVSAWPSGFGSQFLVPSYNTVAAELATGEMFEEAASKDPGTFTAVSEQWCAATISIAPAA